MSKNIEINYKDDSGYEILYPATESRQVLNLLTDSTKTYIGLDPSSTPDDAFRSLYLLNVLSDKASFRLTVKTAGGTPIANLPVTCDKYLDGNSNPVTGPLYTDENGVIDTFFANGNVTLSVTGYADLENWSQQYTVVNGEQYEEEVALTTRNFVRWTSSTTTKFSSNIERLDVNCVGGGGAAGLSAGWGNNYDNTYIASGGGGGSGYSLISEGVSITPNIEYQVVVGSGGASAGATGGASSFIDIVAQGGGGGGDADADRSSSTRGIGGTGNGAGAYGVAANNGRTSTGLTGSVGSQIIFSSFTETATSKGGDSGSLMASGVSNGTNGTNEVGGGGGSGSASYGHDSPGLGGQTGRFGTGGSGSVNFRMHLKAT